MADRPGEIDGFQPDGPGLGVQGPDQGYALKLAARVASDWELRRGEHTADAVAGVVAVALKRASSFGRGPVLDDVKAGAALWGFDGSVDESFGDLRRQLFAEAHHPHFAGKLVVIADAVASDVLAQPLADVQNAAAGWRDALAASLAS